MAAILQRGVAPIHRVAHNLKASSIVSVNISASTLGEWSEQRTQFWGSRLTICSLPSSGPARKLILPTLRRIPYYNRQVCWACNRFFYFDFFGSFSQWVGGGVPLITWSQLVWQEGGEDRPHMEGSSRRQTLLLPSLDNFSRYCIQNILTTFTFITLPEFHNFCIHNFHFLNLNIYERRRIMVWRQPVCCCQETLHCCCSSQSSATTSARWIFWFAFTCSF